MSNQSRKHSEVEPPEWAKRAEHIDHKPDWVDGIPHLLHQLGEVFFPMPVARKGWDYAHHLSMNRYGPKSEILNAFLEGGMGYGIACAGDLVVVDIDEPEFIDEVKSKLPDTAFQVTGSRVGEHLFYVCPGMNTRETLYYRDVHDCDNDDHRCWIDKDGVCTRLNDWSHLGEVKCDPHGYVVGPGSVHPSGNKYGPLNGDKIESIEKEDLLEALDGYLKPQDEDKRYEEIQRKKLERADSKWSGRSEYDFYELTADEVVPWLSPGDRVPHPGHGSDTGTNFMKNEDRETFTCWRHDYGNGPGCGLNPLQLMAQMESGMDCDRVRIRWGGDLTLHWYSWRKAVNEGLVPFDDIPYSVAKGYAIHRDLIEEDEELVGSLYWDIINSIKCEMTEQYLRGTDPP